MNANVTPKAQALINEKPEWNLGNDEIIGGLKYQLTQTFDLKHCEPKNTIEFRSDVYCQVTSENKIQIVTHADEKGELSVNGLERIADCIIHNIDFQIVCCFPNKVRQRHPTIAKNVIGDSDNSVFVTYVCSINQVYDVMYLYETK